MTGIYFNSQDMEYGDHPRFKGVKMAVLVTGEDTDTVSVCVLRIEPGVVIPVHVHEPQIDSIYILSGSGEGYINGDWREIKGGDYIFAPSGIEHGIKNSGEEALELFVHHSPPLL